MYVQAKGHGMGRIGKSTLLPAHLGQGNPQVPEFFKDGDAKIPDESYGGEQ